MHGETAGSPTDTAADDGSMPTNRDDDTETRTAKRAKQVAKTGKQDKMKVEGAEILAHA